MAPGESKDDREKRVSKLWDTLDARKEGRLDLRSLRKSLKKIDHRKRSLKVTCFDIMPPEQMTDSGAHSLALKNADAMLLSILQAVDTNGDGHIDFPGKITSHASCHRLYFPWLASC